MNPSQEDKQTYLQKTFSEFISESFSVDQEFIKNVVAGDGDFNFKEIMLGMFKGIDELQHKGLMTEDGAIIAKIELGRALHWAGPTIRKFDNR